MTIGRINRIALNIFVFSVIFCFTKKTKNNEKSKSLGVFKYRKNFPKV